ncbi:sulfatase [Pyrococcus yayanosii]|uniref:Sulfatase N-terminal domain-containing protein n=1 Tax=Pyrococcus yayanosii (strain CH1 / JCM 16557) TaxID=529709 RepID=F8AHY9_PYRYC|nr:sulfatase [Pyrococcus yayanosii]AEH25446.1 hypothetical protein PYCH_17890 [Pyrococcus yayanosii CH1]
MEKITDQVIKRNLKVYKLFRKVYDRVKFGANTSKDRVTFEQRLKKTKRFAEKFIDFSSKPDKNVILITVDCLRNDHISYNGYQRETTPFLKSIRGYKASLIATSPWTYPAIASLLTGFYPHNHGAVLEGEDRKFDLSKLKPLKENILTLSEILALFDYATYFNSGIDLAFLSVRRRFHEQRLSSLTDAESILNELERWIKNQDNNFFAHVHLKDLHEPISPPNEFYNYFGEVKKLPKIEYWGEFQKPENQKGGKFEEFRENKLLLYDNTLRYVDYVLEQFHTFLEDKGLIDNTILVITADHGEEFWDHAELEAGYFYDVRGYAGVGHGHSVFNELIEVPLIIMGPDIPKKREEDKPVSGVDIVPTLMDLLGIQHNILFDGINIFKAPKKRLILSENTIHGHEKKALVYGKLKFMYSPGDNVAWIFNLKNDPNEQNPIIDEELSEMFIEKLSKVTSGKMVFWRVI